MPIFRLLTAKRCFYTSSVGLAGYVPTVGDYGGPITWKSRDNNIEYLVNLSLCHLLSVICYL